MKTQPKIPLILSALRAFALSAVCAVALIALVPAAFAETKTERLLGEPLNEFAVDENGWTHLHWAALANDEESVRRLLEMGAPVDFKNNGDGSDFSDEANLRIAVALGWGNTKWKKEGATPLMLAISHDVISILIAGGAYVNAKFNSGSTPLHSAAERNATETAALLLENGADVHAKSNGGGWTPLHRAAIKNATETAALLLENGAEVHAKDNRGWTPLHWAALDNATETAALLLENGAYVNAKKEDGKTPLDLAESPEMQAVLQIHGGRSSSELPRE